MGKSVIETITDAAEKMCAEYCKYNAEAVKQKGKKLDEALDKMWENQCKNCPINDLW